MLLLNASKFLREMDIKDLKIMIIKKLIDLLIHSNLF